MDSSQVTLRLEKGVTGFRDGSDPPVPATDPRACRVAWYAAARAARGQVEDFTEQEYPQNFHSATISDREGTHIALFHAHYPLIAFVGGRRYWYTGEFQEPPSWAGVLADVGFVVLSAARLLSPLVESDTSALSAAEWRQIKHWRPETLGATLFNSWD
ncbi:hypothetical protein [Streptomyces hygroscopicus]|uniref:hypothetical protein n=1 Tax=Streptomyces hygroscopicus TaxID=1912 RepID=UPI001FCBBF97|nr:hypothetical protein [Streptomyces hygroscopicus]BDH12742.1 hypothetical protein HOK021_39210 [Streptomyces hygroscopicus]